MEHIEFDLALVPMNLQNKSFKLGENRDGHAIVNNGQMLYQTLDTNGTLSAGEGISIWYEICE